MNLPGLTTVHPEQTELLDELAHMVGECFREELWYATWLDVLDATEERKRAITEASIRADYEITAPLGCVYTLDDRAGAANVYLRSELDGTPWSELEERAELIMGTRMTPEEQQVLYARALAMEPLSDTSWPLTYADASDDFIYFISAGVDPTRRGSGAFGRLFRPFLAYSDEHNLSCYLDCYADRLEQIYAHYGFEVVERKTAPGFDLVERCMIRQPQ